ncbi:unnamed protein product [Eruca vesicaria subsp. sativa]|uniref:Uncharacterized protein n=1 Tax=Eruca vesicaria subsp. sativa TaxID=29727 RepID=A0ABC8M1R1_ERUVS|nr:unnamed protein product [Eruca vesicaria subsp. sativa]
MGRYSSAIPPHPRNLILTQFFKLKLTQFLESADDGYCHVWKWWDVAVTEEMSEFERQLRQLKAQANEIQQSLVNLEKAVEELAKKKSGVLLVFPLGVCALLVVLLACMVFMFKWFEDKDVVIIEFMEELQRLNMQVSDL